MSVAPPSNWTITTGIWGTDADIVASPSLSGGHSLHLKNTAVATTVKSAFFPVTSFSDVPSGILYYVPRVRIRADSIAAGNITTVLFKVYQADRTSVVVTNTLKNAILYAANTWEEYGGAYVGGSGGTTSFWGQFELSKSATAFNVYFDLVHIAMSPPYIEAAGAIFSAFIPSTYTALPWFTTGGLNGQTLISLTGANGETIRIYEPGLYIMMTSVLLVGLADQHYVAVRIQNLSSGTTVSSNFFSASGTTLQGPTLTAFRHVRIQYAPYEDIQIQVLLNVVAGVSLSAASRIYMAKLR